MLSYLDPARPQPWASFLEQVDRVAPYLGKLGYWLETLKHPKRCLIVDVPIHRDDGSLVHFEGYRVQHNVSRGPGKGGVRFHPDVTLNEVMALSGWMTIKSAALNLPYGGAKGGIRLDPAALSRAELERATRRYTSEIGIILGPGRDIPAPDVGTDEQTMAWMMDTYSINQGGTVTGVVTGKPISLGGSLGRREATGRGVFIAGREAALQQNLELVGARVVVQGFGNVGQNAALLGEQILELRAKGKPLNHVGSGAVFIGLNVGFVHGVQISDAGLRKIVDQTQAQQLAAVDLGMELRHHEGDESRAVHMLGNGFAARPQERKT